MEFLSEQFLLLLLPFYSIIFVWFSLWFVLLRPVHGPCECVRVCRVHTRFRASSIFFPSLSSFPNGKIKWIRWNNGENKTMKKTKKYTQQTMRKKLKMISWNGWYFIFYGAWIFRKCSCVCECVWNISLKWLGISIIKRTHERVHSNKDMLIFVGRRCSYSHSVCIGLIFYDAVANASFPPIAYIHFTFTKRKAKWKIRWTRTLKRILCINWIILDNLRILIFRSALIKQEKKNEKKTTDKDTASHCSAAPNAPMWVANISKLYDTNEQKNLLLIAAMKKTKNIYFPNRNDRILQRDGETKSQKNILICSK